MYLPTPVNIKGTLVNINPKILNLKAEQGSISGRLEDKTIMIKMTFNKGILLTYLAVMYYGLLEANYFKVCF